MRTREDIELLELLFVEMDPLENGSAGMLLEVHRQGNRYVLLETAPVTGNRLLRFSSEDKNLVYAVFARELGESSHRTPLRLFRSDPLSLKRGRKDPKPERTGLPVLYLLY